MPSGSPFALEGTLAVVPVPAMCDQLDGSCVTQVDDPPKAARHPPDIDSIERVEGSKERERQMTRTKTRRLASLLIGIAIAAMQVAPALAGGRFP